MTFTVQKRIHPLIVSPDFTGGMRSAAAMIRPMVVTFLDEMLRSDKALRVEEIRVAERHAGQTLGMIDRRSPDQVDSPVQCP